MERIDRIKQAIANKSEMIEMKKAAIKNADSVAYAPTVTKEDAVKAEVEKKQEDGTLIKTVVLNTYNWMDSHEDVHLDGVFTKTANERGPKGANKIFHLADHEYKVTAKVGKPMDIYEKQVSWKELGIDKSGFTTALMMKSEIKKEWNPRMYQAYKDGEIDQHSVGMSYVKIELAADDPDNPEAQKLYNQVLPLLGNMDEAAEKGYFFVVKEARLKEGSAVLMGSNTLTPTMKDGAAESTPESEPLQDTQKDQLQELINKFNSQFNN